jgi:tRNA-specific 2-thiouridylase
LAKSEVREIARTLGLSAAERPESQDACFVPGNDVRSFLRVRRPGAFLDGRIVDRDGEVVGSHDGVPGFTIGQRRGLGLSVSGGERVFVTGLDAACATVTVGSREVLGATTIVADRAIWHGEEDRAAHVTVRARYRGVEPAGTARLVGGVLHVDLHDPLEAPAPGQALVCYEGQRVVGGGVIREAS